jgi:hypothetical protein
LDSENDESITKPIFPRRSGAAQQVAEPQPSGYSGCVPRESAALAAAEGANPPENAQAKGPWNQQLER